VRLLRCGRFEVQAVDLPDAPASFEEFLRFDEPRRHLEFHTRSASHQPPGQRPAIYHGQGTAGDKAVEKRRLADYCRKIDAEVARAMGGQKAPLLLAAAEPLHGLFRQVASRARLDGRSVPGSPDETPDEQLHARAVDLLAGDFDRPAREALERWRQAAHAQRATGKLGEILRAAGVHAVESLLVSLDEQCWGRWDGARGRLTRHGRQQPGDEDLLNLAAVLASGGGAEVHAVGGESLPAGTPAAATLRFRPDT
jgi:hypothetical protein